MEDTATANTATSAMTIYSAPSDRLAKETPTTPCLMAALQAGIDGHQHDQPSGTESSGSYDPSGRS